MLEIYNPESLKHFQVSIPEIEETTEQGIMDCKIFLYVIKITRNDGLEWIIKKRYSEIRALKENLAKECSEVVIYMIYTWRL